MTEYRPPRLFQNPHLATIYAARLARRPRVSYRRERWDTPDGDFIDLDFVDGPAGSPRVVLFHGLEGSSSSGYACSVMAAVRARGWRGVVPHFRGCSGELNRLPRAYHSGDSAELAWILPRLADGAPLHVAGVSLGGNVLGKHLGEQGRAARAQITSAAAICAPVDLHAAADALERGVARVYTYNFLRTLRRGARARLARHPGLFDPRALERARTLRAFDEAVTAPVHGFASADDYYARSSAKPWLRSVEVPLLLLNPLDDPFLPASALPGREQLSASVRGEYPRHGGHVGFVGPRGELGWLATRLLAFFDEQG